MSSKGFVIQSKCYCAEVSYDSNINNIMHILRRIVSLDGSFGPVGRGPWFSTVQTVGGGTNISERRTPLSHLLGRCAPPCCVTLHSGVVLE